MDQFTLVTYMYRVAKREVMDGKGRIFLPDFYKTVPNIEHDPIMMMKAWRQAYPKYPIRQATDNVVLIEFGVVDHTPDQDTEVETIFEEKVVRVKGKQNKRREERM